MKHQTTEHNQYEGRICYYNLKKGYGFIYDTEDDNTYFFLHNKLEQRKLKKEKVIERIPRKFSVGDEVLFKIKPSDKHAGKVVAYELIFIRNTVKEQLVAKANSGVQPIGYLKKIDKLFFVKDIETHLFLPVEISPWEEDLKSVYDDRTNLAVEYNLLHTNALDKLRAVLTDRKICQEYAELGYLLDSGECIQAVVTGRNESGIFATVLDGKVNAFARLYRVMTDQEVIDFNAIKVGDVLPAKVVNISTAKQVGVLFVK